MLYLITGYATEHQHGDPTVIYCGFSPEAAESAVHTAGPEFLRVEKAWVSESFKVRSGAIAPLASPPAPALDLDPAPSLPSVADLLEEENTIEELFALADDEGIALPSGHVKRDYAEIIALFRELDEAHKADEIKQKAIDEGIDVSGLKLKRDFVNAIIAHRRLSS